MKTFRQMNEEYNRHAEVNNENPFFTPTGKQMRSNFLDDTWGFLKQPQVAASVAGIVANSNNNGDLLKAAAAAFVVYKLVQRRNMNKQLKAEQQEQYQQYLQERAEYEEIRQKEMKDLKEPKGALSCPLDDKTGEHGYRASDVGNNLAEKFNICKTDAYKELPSKQQKEYAKFTAAKIEHVDNYRTALAEHGTNFERCSFYDFDGNKIENPFAKGPAAENWNPSEALRTLASNTLSQEALIYGMDHGYITCRMDNGQRFDPSKEPIISKDLYSKHLNKMDDLSEKYAGVDAKVQAEINHKYQHMTDLQKDEFIPDTLQISESQRKNFKIESGVYSNFMAGRSKNIADSYEKGINPYVNMLEQMKTSQGKVRIPEPEEVAARSREMFREEHPKAAKVKDSYDAIINKVANIGKDMSEKQSFTNKDYQNESYQGS